MICLSLCLSSSETATYLGKTGLRNITPRHRNYTQPPYPHSRHHHYSTQCVLIYNFTKYKPPVSSTQAAQILLSLQGVTNAFQTETKLPQKTSQSIQNHPWARQNAASCLPFQMVADLSVWDLLTWHREDFGAMTRATFTFFFFKWTS